MKPTREQRIAKKTEELKALKRQLANPLLKSYRRAYLIEEIKSTAKELVKLQEER